MALPSGCQVWADDPAGHGPGTFVFFFSEEKSVKMMANSMSILKLNKMHENWNGHHHPHPLENS
jgi:hypothetical protein